MLHIVLLPGIKICYMNKAYSLNPIETHALHTVPLPVDVLY